MDKPKLMLLPGLLNDWRLWTQQISGLADIADITVADLSDAASIPDLAKAVLAQAPTGVFALAGLSMGGYVAFEIMRLAPQRISALALLDTTARPDTPEATANRRRLIELSRTDFPGVIDNLLPKLVHPLHLEDAHQVNTIKAMATTLGQDVFVRQQTAMIGRIDSRPGLANITCPALVLCGRDDLITPVEIHEEMHRGIPGSTLRVIDNCGHLATLGQPHKVTAALREWLAGCLQAGG